MVVVGVTSASSMWAVWNGRVWKSLHDSVALPSSSPSRAIAASTSGVGHEALTLPYAAFLASLATRDAQHCRSIAIKTVVKFTIRTQRIRGDRVGHQREVNVGHENPRRHAFSRSPISR